MKVRYSFKEYFEYQYVIFQKENEMKYRCRLLAFSFVMISFQIIQAQYKENDWKSRDTWMDVSKIFDLAEIEEGNNVADVGCHEGYLSIHLSKKVGKQGKVYAVDVRKDRLDILQEHLKNRALSNVDVILGDYDNPKLPLQTLDVVVVMDTYHEMERYMIILEHIKKSLKPGGKIVIIEKFKKHMLNKSREEQVGAHTLSLGFVKSELEEAGFLISTEIKDFGNWKNESDKRIWVLVGVKSNKE
ncbi:class I SAM-dependent methyltransferase [Aquimarina sp. AU474]|uniref:class I SAM-dependent methyltransferase n=1 Tax=Aquimarina sp. AU474 TaxID=2108529 RepID=UPI001F370092|nr:class I SAM-dependent methyltransferase [Aquimarina sp. AU474]